MSRRSAENWRRRWSRGGFALDNPWILMDGRRWINRHYWLQKRRRKIRSQSASSRHPRWWTLNQRITIMHGITRILDNAFYPRIINVNNVWKCRNIVHGASSCISCARKTRRIFYSRPLENRSRFRVVSRLSERFWSSKALTGSPDRVEHFPPAIVKISRSAEFVAVKCHAASSPCGRECRKVPLTMRNRSSFLVTREYSALMVS